MAETRSELVLRKIVAILDEDGRVPDTFIEVASGAFVDPFDLDPELIFIEDIAEALSHCARFSGHTGSRGTEHALIVDDILERGCASNTARLHGLLHDAHEAYLGDVPKPTKMRPQYAFYCQACDDMQERIYQGLRLPMPDVWEESRVKWADNLSLFVEARRGLPSGGELWPGDNEKMRTATDKLGGNFGARYHGDGRRHWTEVEFLYRYQRLRKEAGL